ncbi:hypothetical protein PAPHI01_0701 [Pancytospora philotis]|nr:hypothetical protein PAPHI01_0701 [Pancytospora philotis]
MDVEICMHRNRAGDVCTDCGLCGADAVYADQPGCAQRRAQPQRPLRFSIKRGMPEQHRAVARILEPLGLACYAGQARHLLETADFKMRLCCEDKVCVVLYHICLLDGCPLALEDILPFSKLSRPRLLRAHRNAFKYEPVPAVYGSAVYSRVQRLVAALGVSSSFRLDGLEALTARFPSASASDLCFAAFLHAATSKYTFVALDIVPPTRKERIRKLVLKLKAANVLATGDSTP